MIGLLTEDNNIRELLKNPHIDIDSKLPVVDSLFIDWIWGGNKNPSKRFALQGVAVKHYSKKGIPIVIFDRYMSIKPKEYEWLRKFNNISLFEPALNNRRNFVYLPYYIKTDDNSIIEETDERPIDVGFCGNRNTPSFEKYYINYMKQYNNRNVVCKNEIDWRKVRYTVAIDSDKKYDMGHINISDALSNGCMVLCPEEHKYYIGMFYPYYIVSNVPSIELSVNMDDELRKASVLNLYERVRKDFPEFTLDYTINTLLSYLKR
jgi:hypothetical protein